MFRKLLNSRSSDGDDGTNPPPPREQPRPRVVYGPHLPPGGIPLEIQPLSRQQSTASRPSVATPSSTSATPSLARAPLTPTQQSTPSTPSVAPLQETKQVQISIISQETKQALTVVRVLATRQTKAQDYRKIISQCFGLVESKLEIGFTNGEIMPSAYTSELAGKLACVDIFVYDKPMLHAFVPPAETMIIARHLGLPSPTRPVSYVAPTPSALPVAPSSVAPSSSTTTLSPAIAAPLTLPASLDEAKNIKIYIRSQETGPVGTAIRVWATRATNAESYKKEISQRFGVDEDNLEIRFTNNNLAPRDIIPNDYTPNDMGTDILLYPEPMLLASVPQAEIRKFSTAGSASLANPKPFSVYEAALAREIESYVFESEDVSEQQYRLQQLENLLTRNTPPEDKALLPCYQTITCSGQDPTASDPWKLYKIMRYISPTDIFSHAHRWTQQYIIKQRQELVSPSQALESKELKKPSTRAINMMTMLPDALQKRLKGLFDADTDPSDAQERLIRLEMTLKWAEMAHHDNVDYINQCEDGNAKAIYLLLNSKTIQQNFRKFIEQRQRKFLQPNPDLKGNKEVNKAIFVKAINDYLRATPEIEIIKPKITSNRDGLRLTIRGKNIEEAIDPGLLKHLADKFLSAGFGFRFFNQLVAIDKIPPGLITSGDIVLYKTPNTKNPFVSEFRLFVNVSSCLSKVVKMPTPGADAQAQEALAPPGGLSLSTGDDSLPAAVFSHGGGQNTLFHQNSSVTTTTSTAHQPTTMVYQNQRRQ